MNKKVFKETDGSESVFIHIPHYLSTTEKDEILKNTKNISWDTGRVKKGNIMPRKMKWFTETHINYQFGKSPLTYLDYPDWLTNLQNKITMDYSDLIDYPLNSTLINYYENGSNSVSWHTDDETIFPRENHTIFSISTGEKRCFEIRRMKYKERSLSWNKHNEEAYPIDEDEKDISYRFQLDDGDLLIMSGNAQLWWYHRIVKNKKLTQERINLTFRHVKNNYC